MIIKAEKADDIIVLGRGFLVGLVYGKGCERIKDARE